MATAKQDGPPNTVRVCGKTYSIEGVAVNGLGADSAGRVDHASQRITYDSDWAGDQQRDTVLHEVMHRVELAIGAELDERDIAALATGLYGVIQDNPKLWEWLRK